MEPKIRIKGFSSDWSVANFPECFEPLKTNSLSRADLSESGEVMNVHYGDILVKFGECLDTQKDILPFISDLEIGKHLHNVCPLKKGDIIFADAAEDNTVGKCSELVCEDSEKIVSGLHTIACRPKKDFAEKYLGYFLNSKSFHDQLLPHIQGTKISSISKKALNTSKIHYPQDKEEQRSLADFFSALDGLISATLSRLNSLKQMKAASFQKMFPQKGETKPKVRFKGFDKEWTNEPLGKIFSERIESNVNGEMLSVTMNNGVIKAADNGRFDNSNSDKSKYKVVKVGDIAYNSMRMWQGASGRSQYEGIVSPAYTVIVPCENVDSRFFAYLFKTAPMIHLFRLHSQGLTKDTWNLKYPAFSVIDVLYPESKEEQQKIADYFISLDKQITLLTLRIEKLKQIKSACLDNMFV